MTPHHRVVLVGMMGAGKSTVARALAQRFSWPAIDLDATIERAEGRSIADIFATDGQDRFRGIELAAFERAMAHPTPVVIATGGGTVLSPAAKALCEDATVVWLKVSPEIALERVGSTRHRPLLATDPEGTLRRLAAERDPIYSELADICVDVDALGTAEVLDTLASALVATS